MRILSSIREFKSVERNVIKRSIDGFNNTIHYQGATLNQVEFNIQGEHNLILIHPGAVLNNVSFNLYGDNHRVIVGKNVRFNERGSIWAEDRDCLISIAQNCTFEGVHFSATEPGSKLIVGEDCMFSYDIDVRTGDSHTLMSNSQGKRFNYAKNIIFGEHVWVASHCIFTKGACVPSNSVVGTGSLINKAFDQENILIAGRPAKILKTDVHWLRERVYQSHRVETINSRQDKISRETVSANQKLKQKTG